MSDRRSESARYIRWSSIVNLARQNKGAWFLALADVSSRTTELVTGRRHADLRLPDGKLEASMRHEYKDENGLKRGDLYVRFVKEA